MGRTHLSSFPDAPFGDLNDLYLFQQVIEAGGYTAASRRTGVPKSRLSRRIVNLEDQLGYRLLDRTSRRIELTAAGANLLGHATAAVEAARAAFRAGDGLRSAPSGPLRIASPVALGEMVLAPLVTRFAARHGEVRLALELTARDVDPVRDRFDLVIRGTVEGPAQSRLIARKLFDVQFEPFAATSLAENGARIPEDLRVLPCLAYGTGLAEQEWRLTRTGRTTVHRFIPRFASDNLVALRIAVENGLGVALLPPMLMQDLVAAGTVRRILPGWLPPPIRFHALFASRRGLLPAARLFIDFVLSELPQMMRETIIVANAPVRR